MSIFHKSKKPAISYDPETQQPAVRKSICTGEMTAGFIDKQTGRFTDLMLLDGREGLEQFKKDTGADEVKEIY